MVTGAEGFVGARLLACLVADGATVIACRAQATERETEPRVEWRELDICDDDATARTVRETEPDAVIHLAALSNVGDSWQRMEDYYRVNVEGSAHVAAALRSLRRPCRLIVASSAEVYGQAPDAELPVSEDRRLSPRSPYGLTKAAMEWLTLREGAIVVRPFNLIGPGQSSGFALPSFAAQLAAIEAGRAPPILRVGNLASRRDFVHVDDGARAFALLIRSGDSGRAYNVASGEALEMAAVLRRLVDISGLDVEIAVDAARMRLADTSAMCGDPSRLRALGWDMRRTLDDALEAIWDEARSL